ncbi:MAG TPA: hypothetical protein VIW26_01240, partial [Gemmatimonadales bacterium]
MPYVRSVEARDWLLAFIEALEPLLVACDAPGFEAVWERERLAEVGWGALARARRAGATTLAPVLEALDRRLLAVLERSRAYADLHVVTFRIPELERWQH